MSEPARSPILTDLTRYAGLVEDKLVFTIPPDWPAEEHGTVQVERGIMFAAALCEPSTDLSSCAERLLNLSSSTMLPPLVVVDRHGHQRPVYRPLLIYSWLQTFRLVYETLARSEFGRWEEGLRLWCDHLENELHGQTPAEAPILAAQADRAVTAAWQALTLHVAGKVFIRDAWTDLAADIFGRLTRQQLSSGALLHASISDNPETLWYHELLLLHALANYAVQAEDRNIAAAVARATQFHLNDTQPDHATNQPWALFAFIWNSQTRPIADGILHTSDIQRASLDEGLSLILLADALYCLKLFK